MFHNVQFSFHYVHYSDCLEAFVMYETILVDILTAPNYQLYLQKILTALTINCVSRKLPQEHLLKTNKSKTIYNLKKLEFQFQYQDGWS